jgi:hypothetical protein
MINIKRFIDRVSMIESKQGKDFVMPIIEARGLRDELAKILVDQYQMNSEKKPDEEPIIKLEIKGGSFK